MADMNLPDAPEFELWLLSERAAYRRLYMRALDALGARRIEDEQYDAAIQVIRQRLQLDPLVEAAHMQLIWLYARTGQRQAAFRQYEQCCQILRTELAAEPSDVLTELYADLAAGTLVAPVEMSTVDVPDTPASSSPDDATATAPRAAERSAPPRIHNLPAPRTPFWGRTAEARQIRNQLLDSDYRLLSIVGPGGIGKTRLALHVATAFVQADEPPFPAGVFFVPLASVTTRERMISAIAEAVGVTFSGVQDPLVQLVDALRTKKMLLVLDNCEQLIAVAPILSDLLEAAADVALLCTSRERLNLYEEWCFDLLGLDVPPTADDAQLTAYGAVQLFVDRAGRVSRHFALDENRAEVVRICQLLAGLPLAIELAANWVRIYDCGEIAAQIQHDIDFLSTDVRNVPDRHRSLRATFDHSRRLLASSERTAWPSFAAGLRT